MNEKIKSLGKKIFRAIFIIMPRCIMHKWKRRTKTYQEKLDLLSTKSKFLCMHKILVHAQHSCACTGGARAQGRDPTKSSRPGPDQGRFFVWVPALVPGPFSACTGVLCMHKSVVYAQEININMNININISI